MVATLGQQQKSFTRKLTTVQQGMAYTQGGTSPQTILPTDAPISAIKIRLYGTPGGTTSSAGTLNNPFGPWVAAGAQALGFFTINGSPLDGSDGIKCQNIPAWLFMLDEYLMLGTGTSTNVDISTTIATFFDVTVTIHIMDESLSDSQMFLTALEAMRYGNTKNLNLQIQYGYLQNTTPTFDTTAIAGGTYSGITDGTLAVDIVVEQIIPTNFTWPTPSAGNTWAKPGAADGILPMLDLDMEYQPYPAFPISSSNGIDLNRRRLQFDTYMMNTAYPSSGDLAEVGINNFGTGSVPQIIKKLGGNQLLNPTPNLLQADAAGKRLFGNTAWLDGLYFYSDDNMNINNAPSYQYEQGALSWDLNEGTLPSGYGSQNGRILHKTYNPSLAAWLLSKKTV